MSKEGIEYTHALKMLLRERNMSAHDKALLETDPTEPMHRTVQIGELNRDKLSYRGKQYLDATKALINRKP